MELKRTRNWELVTGFSRADLKESPIRTSISYKLWIYLPEVCVEQELLMVYVKCNYTIKLNIWIVMKNRKFKTQKAIVFMDEHDIIHVNYPDKIGVTLEDAKEEVALCSKIRDGEKVLSIVDLSKIKFVDKEARNYYASKELTKIYSAVVLIVNSPVSRVIGNFFLGLNKPSIPLKLFSNEKEGVKWLKRFIK